MADSPMTLSEHLSTQQAALSTEHARNVAAVLGRIGRVAAVIAQELAHAALRDQLGYVGGANATGDQVKKLDVWGHETMVSRAPRDRAPARRSCPRKPPSPSRCERGRHARPRGLLRSGGRLLEPRRQRLGGHDLLAASRAEGKEPAGPPRSGPGTDQIAAGLRDVRPGHHARLHGRARARTASRSTARPASSSSRTPTSASRSAGRPTASTRATSHTLASGAARLRRVPAARRTRRAAGPTRSATRGRWWPTCTAPCWTAGIFMYPADLTDPAKPKPKLRLLYEVAPMGLLVEQAGGRASTGRERVLDSSPPSITSARPILIGSPEDVATGRGVLPPLDLRSAGKERARHGNASEGDPELVRERQPRAPSPTWPAC